MRASKKSKKAKKQNTKTKSKKQNIIFFFAEIFDYYKYLLKRIKN
jgi:hypothetical protein